MAIRGIMEMVGYRILFQCAMVLGKGEDLPRACVTLIEQLEQLILVTHGGHTRVESQYKVVLSMTVSTSPGTSHMSYIWSPSHIFALIRNSPIIHFFLCMRQFAISDQDI